MDVQLLKSQFTTLPPSQSSFRRANKPFLLFDSPECSGKPSNIVSLEQLNCLTLLHLVAKEIRKKLNLKEVATHHMKTHSL